MPGPCASLRILITLIAGLVLLVGCAGPRWKFKRPLRALEQSLVFQPSPYSESTYGVGGSDEADAWLKAASATPGLAGIVEDRARFEDAWFTSSDGVKLHGWFFDHAEPRAVVLYAHGNGGNISHLRPMLEQLQSQHRVAVMAFDYRGYGRSEGTPDEAGVLADARAARAWLAGRAKVAEREIVLMGRSLGGGVAVDLAATDGARGLILESTFTSLPDVASKQIRWLPVKLIMKNRLNSLAKIPGYHGPLLQSHGDADRLIPYEMGKKLHDAAPGPKRFVTIPGGDHNDPQTAEYYRALDEFIAALPGK